MSSLDLNFRAQVESVLRELVKVATVELTELFETRYAACVGGDGVKSEGPHGPLDVLESVNAAQEKVLLCSVGVQVNAWNDETNETSGFVPLSGSGHCLGSGEETRGVSPTEENGHSGRPGLLVEQHFSQSADKPKSPTLPWYDEDVIHHEQPRAGDPPSSPSEPKAPLVVKVETVVANDVPVGSMHPLPPKQERQDPKVVFSELPVATPPFRPEPRPTVGSTVKGRPSDRAAAAPLPQAEAWLCVSPSKADAPNDLQMTLKRAGRPDRSLTRPCSVQLVHIEAAAKAPAVSKRAAARHESGPSSSPSSSSSSSSASSPPPPRDLRRHQGLHTGHRLCCYTACSNGVWRLHGVVAHTRDGYPCKECGKNFKHRKILRRHARFHTGERPYACPSCAKTFALRKSLRRHARFHSGERPHDCPQCGKSFRLRENLKAHLRFHSGEKPYTCSDCGKTFRIARNLEKHNSGLCGFIVPSFRKIAGLVG